MTTTLVETTRGTLAETVHSGDVAVVDTTGRLLYRAGDPTRKVAFWRSAAKPVQAIPLMACGAYDRFGLEPQDLALCCASHSGEPEHTERVARMLERIGLTPAALRCGPRRPIHGPSAQALLRAGREPTDLHSDCSGKHAGMLALTVHLGGDSERYLNAASPAQREIVRAVCRLTDLRDDELVVAPDGCDAPNFALPVDRMALAYARIADPESLDEPYRSAAARVRDAMTAHPWFVAGTERFCTAAMTVVRGLVAKGGASGVFCAGLTPELTRSSPALRDVGGGVGLALKMVDGGPLGSREVVASEVLRQLGVLDEPAAAALEEFARPVLRNSVGRPTGEARPAFRLERLSR
jgi:L-asparaginase II